MAIKDKDGKIFTLRGPNPLMKTQQEWDRSRIIMFNLGGHREEMIIADVKNPVKEFKKHIVDIGEELKLEKPRAKSIDAKKFIQQIQEPVEEAVLKLPEQAVLNVEPKMARILKERGVAYYCAPAIAKKTHIDDFYGHTYETTQYGDKYLFDAVIIDESDLELQFWCVRAVSVDSVIYKKVTGGGERWWRIKEIESKTGGWLVKAITSDSNPDFS